MSDHNLAPVELHRWHTYVAACERDPAMAEAVAKMTGPEREAWEQLVEAARKDWSLMDAMFAAYRAWQRAEVREWERLR